MLYIIGKSSLLIILLESEVIDMPELNIHQLAALWVCLSACHTQSLVAFYLFQYLHVWKSVTWRIEQWEAPL